MEKYSKREDVQTERIGISECNMEKRERSDSLTMQTVNNCV